MSVKHLDKARGASASRPPKSGGDELGAGLLDWVNNPKLSLEEVVGRASQGLDPNSMKKLFARVSTGEGEFGNVPHSMRRLLVSALEPVLHQLQAKEPGGLKHVRLNPNLKLGELDKI